MSLCKCYAYIKAAYMLLEYLTVIFSFSVFRGKLSPDNLRSYAIWAFDTTQSYASQTYDWVYEKVQTLSKVPWINFIDLLYEQLLRW